MSTNVTIAYQLPTPVRVDGSAMEITAVRIEKRLEGIAEWTEIASNPPSVTSFVDANVPGGTWHYRGFVVQKDGPESAPLEAAALVLDLAAASALVVLTASK